MRKIALWLTYLYFLLCPLEFVLNRLFGSSVKYIALAATVFILMFFIGNRRQTIHIGTPQVCLIAWSVLQAASLLWTIRIDNTVTRLNTYLLMAVLVLALSVFPFEEKELTAIFRAYALGCAALAFLVVFFGQLNEGSNYENRMTVGFLGAYMDPNNLAAILLAGTFYSFHQMLNRHRTSPFANILCGGLFVLQAIAIFLTGSRGGLIALVIPLCLYLLMRSNKKSRVSILLLFAVLILLSLWLLPKILPQTLYTRLFDYKTYSQGSGRIDHWIEAFPQIIYRPLFGFGATSYFGFFKQLHGVEYAMHNTFLAVLFEVGLVGFCFFMLPFLYGLRASYRHKNYCVFIVIFANMIAAFFLDTLHVRFLWNAMALGIMFYELYRRQAQESAKIPAADSAENGLQTGSITALGEAENRAGPHISDSSTKGLSFSGGSAKEPSSGGSAKKAPRQNGLTKKSGASATPDAAASKKAAHNAVAADAAASKKAAHSTAAADAAASKKAAHGTTAADAAASKKAAHSTATADAAASKKAAHNAVAADAAAEDSTSRNTAFAPTTGGKSQSATGADKPVSDGASPKTDTPKSSAEAEPFRLKEDT